MKVEILALLTIIQSVSARWTANLNYRSPSEHHPFMGIAIHKVVRRSDYANPFNASQLNFTHGVASGDPYANSVILWTRVSPMLDDVNDNATVSGLVPVYNPVPIQGGKSGKSCPEYISVAPVCVEWQVSTSEAMTSPISYGTAYTSSDVDYTLKVEAINLRPYTQYYYQFTVCNSTNRSPIGSTKTAPHPDDKAAAVSLAVYSCSNYPFGFFTAFGNPARKKSVDYVLHLGDFIYEYAEGAYGYGYSIDRIPQPDYEIRTLYDYRKRHATYRADRDALASFGAFPWIPVWDDHEVGDNTYRDGMADQNNTEDSFIQYDTEFGGEYISFDQRKMNAVRAYWEWMPIRQVEVDDNLRIWRSFSIGTLFDLIMLDTRQYDRSITDLYWNTDYIHQISNDAGRSMMGNRQENWFYNKLSHSKKRGAAWRLIGSQTVFSRQNESIVYGDKNPLDYDAWDGYQANRNRTFKHLYDNRTGDSNLLDNADSEQNITNNIVMSGDSHMSWVTDLIWLDDQPYDPATGKGAIGVEFAGSAVSSPCPYGQNITQAKADNYSQMLVSANKELQWQDVYYRGYYELTVDYNAVHARFFGIPTLVQQLPYEVSLANFTVLSGANAVQRPVAGGLVYSGALKDGETRVTNITNNTLTGQYFVSDLESFGYGQGPLGGAKL